MDLERGRIKRDRGRDKEDKDENNIMVEIFGNIDKKMNIQKKNSKKKNT